jgi:broad specificity phosphatase PhoE
MASEHAAGNASPGLAPGERYGDSALALIERLLAEGARHVVAFMRHSAREYTPGLHDLLNPLTDEGRDLALRLGTALPKALTVRGYASPPARCMDTAALIMEGHRKAGGSATRHRPVEAFGVFYALDQMKMWKALSGAGGLPAFIEQWVAGAVPPDALIPADLATDLLLRVLAARLRDPLGDLSLDLCVSHDMSLHLLRAVVLGESAATASPVRYLDALALYRWDGRLMLASHDGKSIDISERIERVR